MIRDSRFLNSSHLSSIIPIIPHQCHTLKCVATGLGGCQRTLRVCITLREPAKIILRKHPLAFAVLGHHAGTVHFFMKTIVHLMFCIVQ